MDVDAGEHRLDGGGRGSHALQRRRNRAGRGATGRPSVKKRPELYVIREPEAPVERKVLHFTGIRSHGPADPRPVGRPWPRQIAWRERLRQVNKQD